MSKYKFEFDLSVSIQDVLDADDGKIKIEHMKTKTRTLDFSSCKYLGEIHEIIKNELELPEWYGGNLDALWDAVTGLMYVPANIRIIFKPETKASQNLSEEVEKIISIFIEAEKEFGEITVVTET